MLDKSQLSPQQNTTLSAAEIAKFDQMAVEWWDPAGKFKTALAFNEARLSWIIPAIIQHFGSQSSGNNTLQGLTVLDVGSGGGLVAEAIARRGAQVTGIDASAVSVEVAKRHTQLSGVHVYYRHELSAALVERGETFDVVINAEVVEHVPDQQQLIKECCELVKPGGLLLLATLNRTLKSYIIAIVGAEYVMRYLPRGTHDWRYFVKPSELTNMAKAHGCELKDSTGMSFNLLSRQWKCSNDQAVNYIQAYTKAGPLPNH
jgi:2-polyprenyl-6-hydroxyphenyl methylase/3-demethylubiquinone-9 3-methyltransferase